MTTVRVLLFDEPFGLCQLPSKTLTVHLPTAPITAERVIHALAKQTVIEEGSRFRFFHDGKKVEDTELLRGDPIELIVRPDPGQGDNFWERYLDFYLKLVVPIIGFWDDIKNFFSPDVAFPGEQQRAAGWERLSTEYRDGYAVSIVYGEIAVPGTVISQYLWIAPRPADIYNLAAPTQTPGNYAFDDATWYVAPTIDYHLPGAAPIGGGKVALPSFNPAQPRRDDTVEELYMIVALSEGPIYAIGGITARQNDLLSGNVPPNTSSAPTLQLLGVPPRNTQRLINDRTGYGIRMPEPTPFATNGTASYGGAALPRGLRLNRQAVDPHSPGKGITAWLRHGTLDQDLAPVIVGSNENSLAARALRYVPTIASIQDVNEDVEHAVPVTITTYLQADTKWIGLVIEAPRGLTKSASDGNPRRIRWTYQLEYWWGSRSETTKVLNPPSEVGDYFSQNYLNGITDAFSDNNENGWVRGPGIYQVRWGAVGQPSRYLWCIWFELADNANFREFRFKEALSIGLTIRTDLGGDSARAKDMRVAHVQQASSTGVLSFPGVALLGLQLPPDEDWSGSAPELDVVICGKTVRVFDAAVSAQPSPLRYFDFPEPGDAYAGIWSVVPPGTNPAWIAADFLTSREGLGNYLTDDDIDWPAFARLAAYCDTFPHSFSANFATADDAWGHFTSILKSCRAVPYWKGRKVSCAYVYPPAHARGSTVVPEMVSRQLFTTSNVSGFTVVYVNTRARPAVFEVEFRDRSRPGFAVTTIDVEDPQGNFDPESPQRINYERQTIRGIGWTDQKQARREAMHRHLFNRKVRSEIAFEAPIEALASRVYDLIDVQHDILRPFESTQTPVRLVTNTDLDSPTTEIAFNVDLNLLDTSKTYGAHLVETDGTITQVEFVETGIELRAGENITITPAVSVSRGTTAVVGVLEELVKTYLITGYVVKNELDVSVRAIEWHPDVYTRQVEPGFRMGERVGDGFPEDTDAPGSSDPGSAPPIPPPSSTEEPGGAPPPLDSILPPINSYDAAFKGVPSSWGGVLGTTLPPGQFGGQLLFFPQALPTLTQPDGVTPFPVRVGDYGVWIGTEWVLVGAVSKNTEDIATIFDILSPEWAIWTETSNNAQTAPLEFTQSAWFPVDSGEPDYAEQIQGTDWTIGTPPDGSLTYHGTSGDTGLLIFYSLLNAQVLRNGSPSDAATAQVIGRLVRTPGGGGPEEVVASGVVVGTNAFQVAFNLSAAIPLQTNDNYRVQWALRKLGETQGGTYTLQMTVVQQSFTGRTTSVTSGGGGGTNLPVADYLEQIAAGIHTTWPVAPGTLPVGVVIGQTIKLKETGLWYQADATTPIGGNAGDSFWWDGAVWVWLDESVGGAVQLPPGTELDAIAKGVPTVWTGIYGTTIPAGVFLGQHIQLLGGGGWFQPDGVTPITAGALDFLAWDSAQWLRLDMVSQADLDLFVASALNKANNLSDVDSVPTSRTNLDVYSKAEVDALVGGGGGTVGSALLGKLAALHPAQIEEFRGTVSNIQTIWGVSGGLAGFNINGVIPFEVGGGPWVTMTAGASIGIFKDIGAAANGARWPGFFNDCPWVVYRFRFFTGALQASTTPLWIGLGRVFGTNTIGNRILVHWVTATSSWQLQLYDGTTAVHSAFVASPYPVNSPLTLLIRVTATGSVAARIVTKNGDVWETTSESIYPTWPPGTTRWAPFVYLEPNQQVYLDRIDAWDSFSSAGAPAPF